MTAPLSQQTVAVKDSSVVRKRRRRAPAGGASDDCFSCSKKNIKCDRRRPYCSQCLEVGSECSGYKTQLTWGVGVASRGKLRGLSLPIAKAPPVTREPKKAQPARSRSSSSVVPTVERDDHSNMPRGPIDIPSVTQVASAPTTPYPMAGYDYLSISHPENTSPLPQGSWGSITYSPVLSHSPDTTPKFTRFPLPLVTEDLSSSVDSLHEVDYLSPMSQSFTRDDVPYVHSPNFMYESYATGNSSPGPQSPPTSLYLDHSRPMAPTSCPSLVQAPSDPGSSIHSHMDQFDANLGQKLVQNCDNFSVTEADAYSASYNSASNAWQSPSVQDEDVRSYHSEFAPSHWPTASETNSVHTTQDVTSKIPFLMDYYENIMCPSMVFIDGPQNPFRDHVLRLASTSRSLRHAICALASCNLRMKRKLSLGHDTRELSEKLRADKHTAEAMADAQSQDQSLTEEYQHRNMAVYLLNQQLNDPASSTHDSVLATILLLCHYRMVESGIAKFHTQFAGVNKILALRSRQLASSGDSAWMETLYTYFDAISASINDREAQINPTYFGLTHDHPLSLGAENLVGCDRELFKTIRKLGRLNLLSQTRPVQHLGVSPASRHAAISPSPVYISPLGHSFKDNMAESSHEQQPSNVSRSLPGYQYSGNNPGASPNGNEGATPAFGSTTYDDERSTFWHEWKEARIALQEWQFNTNRVASSLPHPPTPTQLKDLQSLSEAFRYAALLYTERLVSPSLPSNHQSIQALVSQVIFYTTSLETGSNAEKFLLWPLFVAGSECVNELQQSIVRNKCRDIMSRSGYMNNLAALEVLEKLWASEWAKQEGLNAGTQMNSRRGPFNWTKVIGGPGVEVEWIMF